MLIVSHNLPSMNAQRQLGINTKNRAKATEKLSSGFDINRAADNAAGLAISEKMRRLIRGLEQGTRNAEDGISWTQIGDGALNEVHDILHRMTELSVQALNETNSESDRMMLQQEFESLQTELDRISDTTVFNELNIFHEHEATYYQCEGDIKWEPWQMHTVTDGANDLVIKYREREKDAIKTMSITVPAGTYSTQELADEIDTALEKAGGYNEGILFEFTDEGYCNVNYEGGQIIDSVSGSLSYLLYDMYKGGSVGALIGTTDFSSGDWLEITSENNTLAFTIEDFDGNTSEVSLTIPNGRYYREDLIDILNEKLENTSVKATAYGVGIKLASDEAIVTKFKGNMFKIDTGRNVYSSVFYDNVSYGSATLTSGTFKGACVLTTKSEDVEHQEYDITSANNKLILQPNGADAPITLTIPENRYTATAMASQLNILFAAESLELKATRISQTVSGVTYEGIKITSATTGLDSKVGIDTTSSAYNTLFVTREYNSYGTKASVTNEDTADREATFTGSKDLSALSVTTPLVVATGSNDQFTLSVTTGTDATAVTDTYTITLSGKSYESITEVVDELNDKLSGASAPSALSGKVEAVANGDVVMLRATNGSGLSKVNAIEIGGNGGYDAVFQGIRVDYTPVTQKGTGSVTLNTKFDGNIGADEDTITINVGGVDYDVLLPQGNVTQSQITSAINQQLPERVVTTNNEFTPTDAEGNTYNDNFNAYSARGKENTTYWGDSDTGETSKNQGTTEKDINRPASITIGPKLQDSMTVTSANNTIGITINGITHSLKLTEGTYNKDSIITEFQSKIDEKYGANVATITRSGDNMVVTAVIGGLVIGSDTSISCNTNNSSFLAELNTVRTPAVWTSNIALSDEDIVIDSTTNEFTFTLKESGVTRNVTVQLDGDTYSRDSLVAEINKKLEEKGVGVTASVSSGKLKLTSDAVGNDVYITYGSKTGGSSSQVIFGELITKVPARKTVNLKTEDSIVIDSSTNVFNIDVNGTTYSVTLDEDTYTREEFVQMLNNKLNGVNAGIKAYVDGDKIGYETINSGDQQAFAITYAGGGSSMKAIYGQTTTTYPGVTASFTPDGYLKLDTNPGTDISVSSDSGSTFQTVKKTETEIPVDSEDGYKSVKHAMINGVSLNGDVIIDKYNSDLNFTFTDEGTKKTISIKVPENTYTYDELKTKLQELLDAQAGTGKLNVEVGSAGVDISTVGTGSNNRLGDLSGGFYHEILSRCTEKSTDIAPKVNNGGQTVTPAFTVGRQDLKSGGVEIRRGISDTLTLDFTQNGTTTTFVVTLDEGVYTGDGIKAHIQEKLNEQLVANGLAENLIEVGVGDVSTGVIGANDDKALNFKLSKTAKIPEAGPYIIDGVGGNAAFELFYKSDGKLIPAYIKGSKDISDGVAINKDNNQLHFKVDDVEYDVTLDPLYYSPDELVDEFNEKFDDGGVPLAASIEDGKVKISHRKLGDHEIQEISGTGRDDIFFREHGEDGKDDGVRIQLSAEKEDYVTIARQEVSTTLLGLNTICISDIKYATKALDRVSEAVSKISSIRSDFGSSQNKLEHAINSNRNKSENTTSAESRIRDTDMAEMMMEQAKLNILQQAGEAMLAQANTANDGILALLQ